MDSYIRKSGGFTLVELMVVIAIIGIITAIAIPYYNNYKKTACDQAALADLHNVKAAVQKYLADETLQGTTAAMDVAAATATVLADGLAGKGTYGYPGPTQKCGVTLTNSGSVVKATASSGTGTTWSLDMAGGQNAASASRELFSTDFNNSDGIKFLTSNASYGFDDGTLTMTTKKYGQAVATMGDASWKDYTVESTATLDSGPGYGIYYRFTGGDNWGTRNGYVFQYDPGLGNKLVVRTITNGSESEPIQSAPMSNFFPSGDIFGTEQKVSVSVAGDQHTISLNGVQVFNFTDSRFQSGAVGLRTWANNIDNSVTRFDSLSVTQK